MSTVLAHPVALGISLTFSGLILAAIALSFSTRISMALCNVALFFGLLTFLAAIWTGPWMDVRS